jgi:hypothetical protein
MERHESAAWLYGFLAAVRGGDLYAPEHVIEVVERAPWGVTRGRESSVRPNHG